MGKQILDQISWLQWFLIHLSVFFILSSNCFHCIRNDVFNFFVSIWRNYSNLLNFFKGHPSLDPSSFISAITALRTNLTPPQFPQDFLKPLLALECGTLVMVVPMPASSFVFLATPSTSSAPMFYISPFSLTLQWSYHLLRPWHFPSSAQCSQPFHCKSVTLGTFRLGIPVRFYSFGISVEL